jgi:Fic/DOC family
MDNIQLRAFVTESNRIEGILRKPSKTGIDAHRKFLALHEPTVAALIEFVSVIAPGHVIRDKPGLNVIVGRHIAPPGGQEIIPALKRILGMNSGPYEIHVAYEKLHPFTNGNGRSGRVLWLYDMLKHGGRMASRARQLGFLHTFYYQTLDATNDR